MVKFSSNRLDFVFQALSDPTRRGFLREIHGGPKSLSALAARGKVSLPLAAKHVAVLERAGLVRSSKDGRVRTCRFEPGPLQEAGDWIRKYETYWEAGLDRLAEMLEAEVEEIEDGSND